MNQQLIKKKRYRRKIYPEKGSKNNLEKRLRDNVKLNNLTPFFIKIK